MRLRTPIAALAAMLAGCGGSPSSPPTPSPNPGQGETITGRERLGWTQQARDAGELATFDYALYVDGARRVFDGETCTPSGAAFSCSAPLSGLPAGTHALTLAAFITLDGRTVESPQSAPLQVTVAAALSAAQIETHALARESAGSTGRQLTATVLARNLQTPIDLAVGPDGRAIVAHRSGAISSLQPGTRRVPPVSSIHRPDAGMGTLAGIALHPDFARTHLLFALYRSADNLRIVRYREAGGLLGEAAVVFQTRIEGLDGSSVVRFGSDRKLYVAIGAGSDPRAPQDGGSLRGKMLRLNEDGTTPRDNPAASPIFTLGHHEPLGLAWDPHTGSAWEVDGDEEADELNAVGPGRNYGWPIVRGRGTYPGATPAAFTWPAGTGAGSAVFVPADSSAPFAGELLVAARGAHDLLRLAIGSDGRVSSIGGVFDRRFGRIGHVAVAEGAILVTTDNADLWGEGRDLLIAIHR